MWLKGLEVCAYDLLPVLLMGACFRCLKNLEIWLTSLDNFTGIGEQSLGPSLWRTLLKLQEVFSRELSLTY